MGATAGGTGGTHPPVWNSGEHPPEIMTVKENYYMPSLDFPMFLK